MTYETQGYTLFGILFSMIAGFTMLLSYILAVLFTFTDVKFFIFHILSVAGAFVCLYFSIKIRRILKNRELENFLSEIGFLLWFYIFELFSMFIVIATMIVFTISRFQISFFESHKVFCLWLMVSTCFMAGIMRGVYGFIDKVGQKLVTREENDKENMET